MFDFHSFLIYFFKMSIFTTDKHSFYSKNFKFQILKIRISAHFKFVYFRILYLKYSLK